MLSKPAPAVATNACEVDIENAPYHRPVGRNWRHGLKELVLVVAVWFALAMALFWLATTIAGARHSELDELSRFLLTCGALAALIPACMVAVRICGRPAGTLSSSDGRLR